MRIRLVEEIKADPGDYFIRAAICAAVMCVLSIVVGSFWLSYHFFPHWTLIITGSIFIFCLLVFVLALLSYKVFE